MLHRYRRLRTTSSMIQLVSETDLLPKHLIQPIFITDNKNDIEANYADMRGFITLDIDQIADRAKYIRTLGILAIALFPKVASNLKDEFGKEATNPGNIICQAIRLIKSCVPDILIMSDVALDPYTTHGHDGILNKDMNVDNDRTVEILLEQSLTLANAGSDIIAPSDMMDGRIRAIREGLESNGFVNTCILSYSAKCASAFYSPFRTLVGSSKEKRSTLDKSGYHMDIRNRIEAQKEILLDVEEGADMIMIKPALLCLDMIREARNALNVPVFAYHVSGEYAMLKRAINDGILDNDKALYETLISIKRSGANAILTYAAEEMAELIHK